MTPEESTYYELYSSSESGLRGELALWNYYPSDLIHKDILINMLLFIYFGNEE